MRKQNICFLVYLHSVRIRSGIKRAEPARKVVSMRMNGFEQIMEIHWVINLTGVITNDKKNPPHELRHEYLIFRQADVTISLLLISEFSRGIFYASDRRLQF